MKNSIVMLISCGKRKSEIECKAKDMYNSSRFVMLKTIAEIAGIQWFIMSAKYGLLSPDEIIVPYDLSLSNCSEAYKNEWANKIVDKASTFSKDTTFFIAASGDYAQRIVPRFLMRGYNVIVPFVDKDENEVFEYTKKAIHYNEAIELYKCLFEVSERTGGIRLLSECSGKMYWPQRGVYFFVDNNEPSLLYNKCPRIVRVGTHAVSKGSKTTLWHRLKTHKGTNEGLGNHRSSIFRLHVGSAIIKKESISCETWGKGKIAPSNAKSMEKDVELLVSDYIGKLGVIVIDADGYPSSTSIRAFLEKNSISLLSACNSSFNFATISWLGNYSIKEEIRRSCLWNVNHINAHFDNTFLNSLQQQAEITINNCNRQ